MWRDYTTTAIVLEFGPAARKAAEPTCLNQLQEEARFHLQEEVCKHEEEDEEEEGSIFLQKVQL